MLLSALVPILAAEALPEPPHAPLWTVVVLLVPSAVMIAALLRLIFSRAQKEAITKRVSDSTVGTFGALAVPSMLAMGQALMIANVEWAHLKADYLTPSHILLGAVIAGFIGMGICAGVLGCVTSHHKRELEETESAHNEEKRLLLNQIEGADERLLRELQKQQSRHESTRAEITTYEKEVERLRQKHAEFVELLATQLAGPQEVLLALSSVFRSRSDRVVAHIERVLPLATARQKLTWLKDLDPIEHLNTQIDRLFWAITRRHARLQQRFAKLVAPQSEEQALQLALVEGRLPLRVAVFMDMGDYFRPIACYDGVTRSCINRTEEWYRENFKKAQDGVPRTLVDYCWRDGNDDIVVINDTTDPGPYPYTSAGDDPGAEDPIKSICAMRIEADPGLLDRHLVMTADSRTVGFFDASRDVLFLDQLRRAFAERLLFEARLIQVMRDTFGVPIPMPVSDEHQPDPPVGPEGEGTGDQGDVGNGASAENVDLHASTDVEIHERHATGSGASLESAVDDMLPTLEEGRPGEERLDEGSLSSDSPN